MPTTRQESARAPASRSVVARRKWRIPLQFVVSWRRSLVCCLLLTSSVYPEKKRFQLLRQNAVKRNRFQANKKWYTKDNITPKISIQHLINNYWCQKSMGLGASDGMLRDTSEMMEASHAFSSRIRQCIHKRCCVDFILATAPRVAGCSSPRLFT